MTILLLAVTLVIASGVWVGISLVRALWRPHARHTAESPRNR